MKKVQEKTVDQMDVKLFKYFLSWVVRFALLIIWNFAYPQANPLEDVSIGVVLAMMLRVLQIYFVK